MCRLYCACLCVAEARVCVHGSVCLCVCVPRPHTASRPSPSPVRRPGRRRRRAGGQDELMPVASRGEVLCQARWRRAGLGTHAAPEPAGQSRAGCAAACAGGRSGERAGAGAQPRRCRSRPGRRLHVRPSDTQPPALCSGAAFSLCARTRKRTGARAAARTPARSSAGGSQEPCRGLPAPCRRSPAQPTPGGLP